MDADGDVIMGLNGAHLLQQFQNRRDGVRYTVIRPVDIVQLFQSSARLEIKKKKSIFRQFQSESLLKVLYLLKEKTFTSHFATLYIMVRAVDLHFFPSLYQLKTRRMII